MKAVVMTATGQPEILEVTDVPMPVLTKETELLVRLKAAGVNPVDAKLRQRGTYFPEQMPAILGCDGAGIVEAVGTAVTRFKPGDEIYFCNGGIGGPQGNYAQYTVIDQACAAAKPATLSFEEAAAVPLVLITAWEALFERTQIKSQQAVLIHAGAGGVGHMAIQLASIANANIFTTVSTPEKAQFVQDLGARHVIRYQEQDFLRTIAHITQHRGVDIAFDTVGGPVFAKTFAAVKFYGDIVTLLQPGADCDWKEARLRNLRASYVLMLTPMLYGLRNEQLRQATILALCAPWFDQRKLRVHVQEVLPLHDAARAHRLLENGSCTGKLVLTID